MRSIPSGARPFGAMLLIVCLGSLATFSAVNAASGAAAAATPFLLLVKAPTGIGLGKEVNVTVNATGGPAADAQPHEKNYSVKAWLIGDMLEGATPLVGTPFSQNNTNGNFTVPVKAPSKKASLTLVLEAVSRGANGSTESARKEVSIKAVNPITINVVIDNKGDVAAKNVSLSFYLDGSFIGEKQVAEVPASNKTNVSFDHAPPDLAPGAHQIRVILDPKGQLVEFEEGNNVLVKNFYIHREPDNAQPYFVALVGLWLVGMVVVAARARRKKREK